MRRFWPVLVLLLLSVNCASTPVRKPSPPPLDEAALDDADARVLEGCYDCLLDARAAYEAAAKQGARAVVLQRLFETNLLIAFREKEFDLAPSGAADEVRMLAAELPAEADAPRYAHLLDVIVPEHGSLGVADLLQFRRAHADVVATLGAQLNAFASGPLAAPVRQYVAITLGCTWPGARLSASDPGVQFQRVAADAPPLVQYRGAACRGTDARTFTRIHDAVPRFAEAAYFLGNLALAQLPDGGGDDPRPLIAEARTRFPDATAVVYLAARMQQTVGESAAAMALYDQILEGHPNHEDAWLGRVMCLTDLSKPQDAVGAASHMIDAGFDLADALYWRAFNNHTLERLTEARADVDRLRTMPVGVDLRARGLMLAGIIEHDQNDLDPAERDLLAIVRSGTVCAADWYLGSVYVKRTNWKDAATYFDTARTCFEADAATQDQLAAGLGRNERLDAEYKRAQIARLAERAADDRKHQRAASVNAAKYFAATGSYDVSRRLLDIAEGDKDLEGDIVELRQWLDRVAPPRPAPGS